MKVCRKRLQKEFIKLQKEPVPNIEAYPNEKNIKEWHYVIFGPKDTPYSNGVYHGRLVFPTDYPYKPPAIYMITTNGRFKTKTRLCLSISDFHPESWNPLWSVGSILTGLLSFMLTEEMTTGSLKTSNTSRRQLAAKSMQENFKNPQFCQIFPHLVTKYQNQAKSAASPDLASDSISSEKLSNSFVMGLGLVLSVCVAFALSYVL